MIHLTARNFEIETKKAGSLVVVMFYAVWCGKCAMMKPVVHSVEERLKGKVKFYEIDIEESSALAAEYGADIVPTFVLFQDGQIYSAMQGVINEDLFEERVRDML